MTVSVQSIEILELCIPFRFRYGHAKARHKGVRSILCIARDNAGREGYGEAVPRPYVTGESTESVRQGLAELVDRCPFGSFDTFQEWLRTIESSYPQAVPACAICALEMALTDLTARQRHQSVVEMLGGEPASPLKYTASIGMGSRAKLIALLLLYKSMGLRRFKAKVGDEDDLARIRLIRRLLGHNVSLFADANGAWDKETAASRIEQLAAVDVWAVEEPLRVDTPSTTRSPSGQICRELELTDEHLADNAWLQSRTHMPLIADESLISLRAAKAIVETSAFKVFNIRLSKCGGYLRSAQFAAIARDASLSYSLGAMVGESPILATAGAAWAASQPEHLYIQGHSHRVLHGVRFVEGCPPLRRGGNYHPNQRPGSGLRIDHVALNKVVQKRQWIDVG